MASGYEVGALDHGPREEADEIVAVAPRNKG